jgi:hypothetical protein
MTSTAHAIRSVYTNALDNQKIVEVRITRKLVDGQVNDYVTILTEGDIAGLEDGEEPQGVTFPGRFLDREAADNMVGFKFNTNLFEDGDDFADHWGIRFTGAYGYVNTVMYCRGGEALS